MEWGFKTFSLALVTPTVLRGPSAGAGVGAGALAAHRAGRGGGGCHGSN
jgi:hypothetical protein